MDRDIVNALHYLYQMGEVDWPILAERLWCGPDSGPTVNMYVKADGSRVRLTDEMMRFLKAIEDQLANLPKPDFAFSFPFSQAIREPGHPRPCFVAMPYGPTWFEPVKRTVVMAASAAGFQAEVSIDLATPGTITDQIWQGIRRSDVVVADVTDSNPNVFYELGLAHALGKEVIVITQAGGPVPFDIRASRFITYSPGELSRFEADLSNAFRAVTARYPYEGPEPRF
jgi:hypothetical protein